MMPGLPPPRDRNEISVPSRDIQAILDQSLRCVDPMPKAGALSFPPTIKLLFQQVEELLAILGGQQEHWKGGHSP